MKEQAWVTATDPVPMLEFARSKLSGRKLRLFACACAGRSVQEVPGTQSAALRGVVYRYADGLADRRELDAAQKYAEARYAGPWESPWVYAANPDPFEAAALTAEMVVTIVMEAAYAAVADKRGEGHGQLAADAAAETEQQAQVELLRHLCGSPFRPYPVPATWPALVVDLALQLYDGADVWLVLHDALLDAGHAELAGHFRAEEWHPKGCWVLDLVLGKN